MLAGVGTLILRPLFLTNSLFSLLRLNTDSIVYSPFQLKYHVLFGFKRQGKR
jgi:hypothetical protein